MNLPLRNPSWRVFFWSYLRRYRLRLVLGAAFLVGRDVVAYTIPLFIRSGVNSLTHAPLHTATSAVTFVSLAIALMALPRFALQTASRLSLMTTSRHIEYEMRADLMRHFFALDSKFWARTRVGDAMAHAINDLNAVRMMVGPGATALSESLTALPIALIVMGSVNWQLTLAALLPAPIVFFVLLRAGRVIRVRFDAIQELFSTMSATVQQTVSGARVVRAFAQEESETRRFDVMNRSYAKANRELAIYSGSLDPLLVFHTGLSILIVLAWGGRLVSQGRLGVGDFVMFSTYMVLLARPVSALGRAVNLMQRGAASVVRLNRLFQERPSIFDLPQSPFAAKSAPLIGDLYFDHVSVRFGDCEAIAGLTLHVPFGSSLAVLGPTGSGKSTLARLVPRLIDPDDGHMLIDERNARDLPLDQLRSAISLSSQETFLFSATLAENIALGKPEASEEEIDEAARMAGLTSDLQSFPLGLETIVGERGVTLSGGQKQRVALARALVRRPRILVLDDTLARVDAVTAEYILNELSNASWPHTTIFIAHRVSAARYADRIVILDAGRLVESGDHDSLLARGGYYTRMMSSQNLACEQEVS